MNVQSICLTEVPSYELNIHNYTPVVCIHQKKKIAAKKGLYTCNFHCDFYGDFLKSPM